MRTTKMIGRAAGDVTIVGILASDRVAAQSVRVADSSANVRDAQCGIREIGVVNRGIVVSDQEALGSVREAAVRKTKMVILILDFASDQRRWRASGWPDVMRI